MVGLRREPYMRRLLWWQTKAKAITPIDSNMPERIMREPRSWPLASEGTRKDCVTTVTMMTVILIKAKPLALASYKWISLCTLLFARE